MMDQKNNDKKKSAKKTKSSGLDRRYFVKASTASSLILASGLVGSQAQARPNKARLVRAKNPNAPRVLGEEKTALVIGAGLAGLSCALELAERGYKVRIRESGAIAGGRLHTRHENTRIGSFKVEHGLHMWFDNYHVFHDIIERLKTEKYFTPVNEVHFIFRQYEDEILKSEPPQYPLNMINLLRRSKNMSVAEGRKVLGLIKDVMYYDHAKNFAKLDHLTMDEWAAKLNLDKKFFDLYLYPAASVTLNDPAKVSAAEMTHMMHMYFTGQPKAMNRTIANVDHETAVIGPLIKKLKYHGVEFEFNSPVSGLKIEDGRVSKTLDQDHEYDWVVMSSHVPGSKSILKASIADDEVSGKAHSALLKRFGSMRVAPPYKVLRVWFDRQTRPGSTDVLETPEHSPINLIAQFHLIEEESRQWADLTGGSVIEFHLYNIPTWQNLAEDEIWNRIRPTVLEIFPEMSDAKILDWSMGSYEDFTSYEVGQATIAPSTTTAVQEGISNLLFCGDWVKLDFPAALMEKAVASGRVANNHILLQDGVRQADYTVTASHGPGII